MVEKIVEIISYSQVAGKRNIRVLIHNKMNEDMIGIGKYRK